MEYSAEELHECYTNPYYINKVGQDKYEQMLKFYHNIHKPTYIFTSENPQPDSETEENEIIEHTQPKRKSLIRSRLPHKLHLLSELINETEDSLIPIEKEPIQINLIQPDPIISAEKLLLKPCFNKIKKKPLVSEFLNYQRKSITDDTIASSSRKYLNSNGEVVSGADLVK